jgi:hypothetical protein
MELEKNRKESGGKNWILKNEKRVFQSCFDHPRLFWTIIIVGGTGDTIFYYWFLGE